jgi:PPOX class probable F420-dependent enzyme
MSLDPNIVALLERPNFVHVATLMPDGSPQVVGVWAGVVDEDKVAFFTQPGSQKARNLERDPRVAFSVIDHEDPYKTARLRGRVVEVREGDAALEVMDVLSVRHTGEPFPVRSGVLFVCAIERAAYSELPFQRKTA